MKTIYFLSILLFINVNLFAQNGKTFQTNGVNRWFWEEGEFDGIKKFNPNGIVENLNYPDENLRYKVKGDSIYISPLDPKDNRNEAYKVVLVTNSLLELRSKRETVTLKVPSKSVLVIWGRWVGIMGNTSVFLDFANLRNPQKTVKIKKNGMIKELNCTVDLDKIVIGDQEYGYRFESDYKKLIILLNGSEYGSLTRTDKRID